MSSNLTFKKLRKAVEFLMKEDAPDSYQIKVSRKKAVEGIKLGLLELNEAGRLVIVEPKE